MYEYKFSKMNMQEWRVEKESETLDVKSGRQKSFKDVFSSQLLNIWMLAKINLTMKDTDTACLVEVMSSLWSWNTKSYILKSATLWLY